MLNNSIKYEYEEFIIRNKIDPSALINNSKNISNEIANNTADIESYLSYKYKLNSILVKELLFILDISKREGFEIIPFKSLDISLLIYENIYTIEFSDIDFFFFRKNDIDLMVKILKVYGYEFFSKNEIHYSLRKGLVMLDFHFKLFPDHISRFNLKKTHLDTMPIQLADTTISVIKIEYLILILCIHAAKHCYERFDRVIHLSNLIKKYNLSINWNTIYLESKKEGCLNMVLLGLKLSKDYNNIFIPENIMKDITDNNMVSLAVKRIYKRLFNSRKYPSIIEHIYFNLLLCRKKEVYLYYRIYLFKLLFKPNNSDRILVNEKYPELFFYFYRPIRIFFKYIFKIEFPPIKN